jgi:hypothetical protein
MLSKGERFLPPFLDRSAKLDKHYPTVESFMADNEAGIQDFRTIVVSACRCLKGFTKENSFSQYMGLPPHGQGVHTTWFKWWGNSDPDVIGNLVVRAVPIQSAATLGRADFGVNDLERLPHFPPVKVYGCYFNDIIKPSRMAERPPL